jgi:hypothetical protein
MYWNVRALAEWLTRVRCPAVTTDVRLLISAPAADRDVIAAYLDFKLITGLRKSDTLNLAGQAVLSESLLERMAAKHVSCACKRNH